MKNFIFLLFFTFFYVHVNAQQFIPNPDEIYHIQAVNGQYLAANGASNDAYTVTNLSNATSSDDVEWQFVQHPTTGLWHIQRAAGGTRSRIRSDRTDEADMQSTTSSGDWTQYDIEESPDYPDAHYLTTINSGHTNRRLELTTQKVKKTTEIEVGDGVSFRFTIVQDFFYEKIDYSHLYDNKTLPINVAHRGKWEDKGVPENSQAAIQLAQNDNNIDWLEIDVKPSNIQLTGTGDNVTITSLQPIIFHDDYPHRLISASTWSDDDLVYDNDMTSRTLSDRFGNETAEPLMTLEEFFQYIVDNSITKPINLDISNKSFLSNRIANGSQAVTDVYNIMFLKAVQLIFQHNLNNQIFLKNTYAWDHAIWGLNATNKDIEGPNASVTSIMNFYENSLGIMYTPKFGEETYNGGDDTVYWDPWLGIAKTPTENPHPATVVGFEIRLKKDDGEAVTYQLQTYINEAKDTHDGEEISINSGIFSEGTVACEGTWDNLASRKYVDFTQDRRNSVEWLETKGYGYIITDFPDQLSAFKNREKNAGNLGSTKIPLNTVGTFSNAFKDINTNGGFSLSNILIRKNLLGTERAFVEMKWGTNIIWRLGTTANKEIYIDRLMENGDVWKVIFWEPRETGTFEDISNTDNIFLSVSVNDLETRIYIGTPDGKFDCMYLDYGFENSVMKGQFKNGVDDPRDYQDFTIDINTSYQSGEAIYTGKQVCRTNMFREAIKEYFTGASGMGPEIADSKEAFSFLNDENPYFSNGNNKQKDSNEKAFNGESTNSCISREEVDRRLDEVTEGNLYLIIGQSNAAGRGLLPDVLEPYENVSVLNNFNGSEPNELEPANPNLNFYSNIKKGEDKQVSGYCMGYTFGGSMQHVTGEPVNLVVNARGATRISHWLSGAAIAPDGDQLSNKNYFNSAVARVNEAIGLLPEGTKLSGILWHQGESDSSRDGDTYKGNLKTLIEEFRAEFGDDLPFVMGELNYQKIDEDTGEMKNAPFNAVLNSFMEEEALELGNVALVSAETLFSSDKTHYTTASLREMGDLYALEMLKLKGFETLPENLPRHPEIELVELFPHETQYVYQIESLNGFLLAANPAAEDAGEIYAVDTGTATANDISVEWKFVDDEDSAGVHIDFNAGGEETRLYIKGVDDDEEVIDEARLTKDIFSGTSTFFFLEETNSGDETYHITALSHGDSRVQRLEIREDGDAYWVAKDIETDGTIFKFNRLEKEVELPPAPEEFEPIAGKSYIIKSLANKVLVATGEAGDIPLVRSTNDIGPNEKQEWEFVKTDDNTSYYIQLAAGGAESRLLPDGELTDMISSEDDNVLAPFKIETTSVLGQYYITATGVTTNLNTLQLHNNDNIVEMVSRSNAGDKWAVFTILDPEAEPEVEPGPIGDFIDPEEILDPEGIIARIFHIRSEAGNLLAGFGKNIEDIALETGSVAGNTTGEEVEWKFLPHETISNAYYIDLVAGGQQDRLYTDGSGIASLTGTFTATGAYFFIEKNGTTPETYTITANNDNQPNIRLQLDPQGSSNMTTNGAIDDTVSFTFIEVTRPLVTFTPDLDKVYIIKNIAGRKLAGTGARDGVPFPTLEDSNTDVVFIEWEFVKTADEDNSYYIQLVGGDDRQTRILPSGGLGDMIAAANNHVKARFIIEELGEGSEEYIITSTGISSDGLNTLRLTNLDPGTAVMVNRSEAGSTLDTFTITEAATVREFIDPTVLSGKMFHIRSEAGNLLAGYGKNTEDISLETGTVAGTFTGPEVEWKFLPHETISNAYYIDLVAGGQQDRLYTDGSGVASLTGTFTATGAYFFIEKNGTTPETYTITANDDDQPNIRLKLTTPGGGADMTTNGAIDDTVSFTFIEVTRPLVTFTPDLDKVYIIKNIAGRKLAGTGARDGVPFPTLEDSNTDVVFIEWKFVKTADEDNSYYIQLVGGDNRQTRILPSGGFGDMIAAANNHVKARFIIEELGEGSEEYIITSTGISSDGLNTLRLTNLDPGTAVMVNRSEAGSTLDTFTITEAEPVRDFVDPEEILNKVFHIKSEKGNLLAGYGKKDDPADEAGAVAGNTTGKEVEWKFLPHETVANAYHIDLNVADAQDRLYANGSNVASLTGTFKGDGTYFFIEKKHTDSSGRNFYQITANDNQELIRLQLNFQTGTADMVVNTLNGIWNRFEFIEVTATPAATFTPVEDVVYTIKNKANRILAATGEPGVPFAVTQETDLSGIKTEWKFIKSPTAAVNSYYVQLDAGGTRPRLYANEAIEGTPVVMVKTGNEKDFGHFIMEETEEGSEEYFLISTGVTADGLNTLRLNSSTGEALMIPRSEAGSTLDIFTITEEVINFKPDLNKVYHIESVAGNLLAGDGSETNAAIETTTVAGTTTGNTVEWRFFENELKTGYHIDLVEGGEESRLYTNGSGIASLTQNTFTSNKTYFVMEERNSGSNVYHITAVDDTSGANRLELDSNGDTNMISSEPTNAASANFIFNEVGSFFEPQVNTSYHIQASNGHRLDTSGTDLSTTTTASGSYANASWKFVKNENGYYHIDFSSEVFGIRRLRINFQGVISLVDVSDVGSNTQFQMREFDQRPGSYFIQAPNGSVIGKRLSFINDGVINTAVGNALGSANYSAFEIIEASSVASLKTSISSNLFSEEELSLSTIILYPNPASEMITVEGIAANELLIIYNILGEKVLETTDKEISISELSKGLYILKTAKGGAILKFVKQ